MLGRHRRVDPSVGPDAGPHVTGTGGEIAAGRAGGDRDDRVLVSLQHKLRRTGTRVPELNATILGARQNPLRIRGKRDAEYEVLVAGEQCQYTGESRGR